MITYCSTVWLGHLFILAIFLGHTLSEYSLKRLLGRKSQSLLFLNLIIIYSPCPHLCSSLFPPVLKFWYHSLLQGVSSVWVWALAAWLGPLPPAQHGSKTLAATQRLPGKLLTASVTGAPGFPGLVTVTNITILNAFFLNIRFQSHP